SGPGWSAVDLHIATEHAWPISDRIRIERVGLIVRVRPSGSPKVSGTVYGSLSVDPLTFMATVPIPLLGTIRVSGRTNQPLPGFGALVALVDAPFASSLPEGI